ncbi:Arc family DNA-binding protein [Bradyrhizobium australafricanum]|uniref:Arc family DNA-binding protein n=1 Tax=Bradyrhizobium australafricanum TaxID=2821406 RepID=UPI001CE3863F|nr:Arc family DNA-binding protein [Bradyrhizobium australafricanum]MCA6105101.1 Arc family DNA-binding protein [Bradyrhizobium australafricanum]
MAARVKKRTDTTSTNRDSDKIIVRLPEGMRDHLALIARRNGRSMNAEVVTALAHYFAMTTTGPLEIETVADLEYSLEGIRKEITRLADAAANLKNPK